MKRPRTYAWALAVLVIGAFPAGLGQRRHVRRTARDRSAPAPHGEQSRSRRDPLLRADHRAVDVARRVRSELHPDAAVQAELRLQRTRAGGRRHRRRRGIRRASVLRAGLRPLRRQHQLRQHPLVLGAQHRQPRVQPRRIHLQRQLLRTGELRVHSARRPTDRSAQPAATGPGDRHAELPHLADEPRRHDRRAHVRRQAAGRRSCLRDQRARLSPPVNRAS
jgi:hypothetical protein